MVGPDAVRSRLRAFLEDWQGLLTESPEQARPLLDVALTGRIAFRPIGEKRFELTVSIAFDRIVTMVIPEVGRLQDRVASPTE